MTYLLKAILLIYSTASVICSVGAASTMQQRRLPTMSRDHGPVFLTEGKFSDGLCGN